LTRLLAMMEAEADAEDRLDRTKERPLGVLTYTCPSDVVTRFPTGVTGGVDLAAVVTKPGLTYLRGVLLTSEFPRLT
jgi:hypothetical protein